jgi:hypothetical protein
MDDLEFSTLHSIHRDIRRLMQQFDDLTTTVNALIAADEAENTLLASLVVELNALLANPTGVSATDVTALRDKVQAELDKVNAAIGAATPPGTTGVPPALFTVGGVISGLATGGSMVLLNNGADAVTITSNGPFVFPTGLLNGAAYAVTVGTQPSGQAASVAAGTGTVAGANVTNVAVTAVAAPVTAAALKK